MVRAVNASELGRRRLRCVAPALVMPPAALAVHQLRYYLAFGSGATAELQRTGHSYLHSWAPWIVALLALTAGGFLWSLGNALAAQRTMRRYTASLLGLWLVCSAMLVGIFAAQELLEGLFATGHPAGWVGIFGYGGWWAIPAALCIGMVLAALYHGARWVLEAVARQRHGARGPLAAFAALAVRAVAATSPRPVPLVDGWSGRGPPY